MEPLLDLTKEYGLVLDGGGARGAYQIGAWTALEEAGVKVCAVAGTSVGALNGIADQEMRNFKNPSWIKNMKKSESSLIWIWNKRHRHICKKS